jgi:hypothetical protein
MINRILHDDPSKGDMHNRQGFSGTLLWEALTDYDLWPISLLGLTWTIPNTPIQAYLTLVLRGLGFSTFQTNLLTIPAYVLFLCQLIFWTWFGEKLNNRFFCVLCSQIWMFPLLVALEVMGATQGGPWARYALSVLLYGFPTSTPSLSPSRRATRVACARTVGSAIYNMCVQASSIYPVEHLPRGRYTALPQGQQGPAGDLGV